MEAVHSWEYENDLDWLVTIPLEDDSMDRLELLRAVLEDTSPEVYGCMLVDNADELPEDLAQDLRPFMGRLKEGDPMAAMKAKELIEAYVLMHRAAKLDEATAFWEAAADGGNLEMWGIDVEKGIGQRGEPLLPREQKLVDAFHRARWIILSGIVRLRANGIIHPIRKRVYEAFIVEFPDRAREQVFALEQKHFAFLGRRLEEELRAALSIGGACARLEEELRKEIRR